MFGKRKAKGLYNTVAAKALHSCQLWSLKHEHLILRAQYKQVAEQAAEQMTDWIHEKA